MEEVIKSRIEITDEGVIYIDWLLADYAAFDEAILKYSVYIVVQSKQGYEKVLARYKDYLYHHTTIKELHRRIDYLEYLFKVQAELAEKAIASNFRVIKAAARILGKSENELYQNNIERLKKENHD